jgi:glycosyltransferase involved in cell wall biosynthesis
MALNEHDPTGPSGAGEAVVRAGAPVDAEGAARLVADLVDRAERAVLAGDSVAFAAALADIASVGHLQRRHQARLRVVEQVLLPRPSVGTTALSRLMLQALDALLLWLGETPAEPTLLGYAGVLAAELGSYRASEDLFAAAIRLDPDRADIEASLAAVRARRKAKATVLGLPGDVRHQLPGRGAQLRDIARSAEPAQGLRVSLCMIVRDEEEMLPRCLAAAAHGVDEMVIVDTGSRDRTVEIAASFGARIIHHEWTGDFSEARNLALDAATGDWLVWLDADEVFVGEDARALRELAGHTWRECFRMEMIHHLGDVDDGDRAKHATWRMCRNRPEYRFTERVHEQITQTFPAYLLDERFEHTNVRIDHFGYLGQVRVDRGKSDRNMALLEEQVQAGDDTPFVHFNLGSEYLVFGDDASQAKALEHFRIAFGKVTGDLNFKLQGYLPSLVLRYVRALRVHEEWEEMDRVCALVQTRFPGFTDIVFEQGLAAIVRDDLGSARESFERCLELGDAPAIYSPNVGCGTHLAELRLASIDLHEGKLDDAIRRYAGVRDGYPEYLGLIDPYASLLLARGATPEEVLHALTDKHDLSPSGWFMLGVNLQERGHGADAEAAFRAAIARRPTFDQARVALADGLLVQGRIAEALAEVQDVPVDVRVGGAALRTAIFACLVLEDASLDAGLSVYADRLASTDLSASTRDVLAAWIAVRLGAPPAGLGMPHVDELGALMGATLRLGAADAFAELVALLDATGLGRRDQHEILATLFLRCGLTELAADEWIAAVQESGADADAFAGLAEVARLQNMPDDARTLATEALDFDADQPLARRVLDAVGA